MIIPPDVFSGIKRKFLPGISRRIFFTVCEPFAITGPCQTPRSIRSPAAPREYRPSPRPARLPSQKKNQGEIRTNVPLRPGVSNWVNQTLFAVPLVPTANFTAVLVDVSLKVSPSYGIRKNGMVVWPG